MKRAARKRQSHKSNRGVGLSMTHSLQSGVQSGLQPVIVRSVAFAIIAGTVMAAWFITPIPIAVSLTLLAVVRVGIFVRELRKQSMID